MKHIYNPLMSKFLRSPKTFADSIHACSLVPSGPWSRLRWIILGCPPFTQILSNLFNLNSLLWYCLTLFNSLTDF